MPWFVPILIFVARICDVSIGTVRTVFVVSGYKKVSVMLGFVEVLIWVLAVGGVMKYLTNPLAVIGYAGGYATGILVGMTVEDRIAVGLRMIRVINPDSEVHVADMLREKGLRVTRIEGSGQKGPVEVSFSVIQRRRVPEIRTLLREHAPAAFITVERVDRADGAIQSPENTPENPESRFKRTFLERLMPVRK